MAELTVPRIDFSPLGDLPNIYREGVKRRTLSEIGSGLADGSLDYNSAGAKLAGLGDLNSGLSLIKLGQEQKAGQEFMQSIPGLYGGGQAASSGHPQSVSNPMGSAGPAASTDPRGIRNNNPLNLEASPFTQSQPGFSGSDGRFGKFGSVEQGMAAADKLLAGYGQRGINTISGIINRWAPANDGNPVSAYASFVAQKAGIDPNARIDLSDPSVRARILPAMAEFENGRPVQVASNDPSVGVPQPQQQAPAAPQGDGFSISPRIQGLLQAVANPRLPAAQKDVAKILLQRELDNSKLPEPVKQYMFAKSQGYGGSFMQYQTELKKAGSTNVTVDQRGETKFDEEFGKKQADRWNSYLTNADAARKKLVDIDTMREISGRMGSQGAAAGIKEAIGPYAEALGINVDGLSDIQAYNQIIQRLAPQQRAVGSGSTSDIEFKGFLKSLPGLSQNPAAREMGLNTMEALSRDDIARGEIASKLATGEIKRAEAEKQLRALPDPMKGFVEWRKANPQLYSQALKGAPAPAPKPVQSSAPPAQGARQAPDGNWYVQQNGQWFRVDQ